MDITDDLNLSITNIAGGGVAANYVIYNAATIGCVVYVGGAGNIKMVMADTNFPKVGGSGASVAFQSIPAGSFLPTQIIGIHTTGTTATDIVGLW